MPVRTITGRTQSKVQSITPERRQERLRALSETIRREHRRLVQYAGRLAGNDAEDVVAIAYERAVRYIASFRDEHLDTNGMQKWLYRITRTTAIDTLQSAQRTQHSVLEEWYVGHCDRYPSDLDVASALVHLTPTQQTALVMSAQGYTYGEIGRAIGKTLGGTKTIIHRARKIAARTTAK